MRAPAKTPRSLLLGSVLGLTAASVALGADTLFVSRFLQGDILRFDLPSATPTTIVTGLTYPEDGACSPVSGLIYFPESISDRVSRWNPDGTGFQNVVPAAGTILGPEGLCFNPAGDLFLNTRETFGSADGAWRILGGNPANPATQIVPPFSTFGEGATIVLAGPHAGALLLVARGEARVLISEPPGASPVQLIPASAFPPGVDLFGIATNGCGEVFVAFTAGASSSVYRFNPDGSFRDVYGTGYVGPTFLEFDSAGNLYVADGAGGRIHRIAPDLTQSVFATLPNPHGLAMCRDQFVPLCSSITCDAGGPYLAECAGATTCVDLDGSASHDSLGSTLSFSWTSDCPGASFSDPTLPMPELCVSTSQLGCELNCLAMLEVTNGTLTASCEAPVRVVDSLPPVVDCELRPARPPGPASSQSSFGFGSPLARVEPRAPRLASSACSGASSGLFEVRCQITDTCDAGPQLEARVVVTRTDPASCRKDEEAVEVSCGELVELVRLAAPCPARPPRSPRPPVSVRSDGIRTLAGEELRLEVDGHDACGNRAATCVATVSLCAPRPPRCPGSPCP